MTATDELRRLLDERGVEYYKHEDGEPLRKLEKAEEPATSWHMGGASVCAVPIEGSELFDLWIDHCTPEQAIAATLGSGECEIKCFDGGVDEVRQMMKRDAERTCHDKNGFDSQLGFECTVCETTVDSYMIAPSDTGHEVQFTYCPGCGRRVKEVGA